MFLYLYILLILKNNYYYIYVFIFIYIIHSVEKRNKSICLYYGSMYVYMTIWYNKIMPFFILFPKAFFPKKHYCLN
jgi:hypothetical protein